MLAGADGFSCTQMRRPHEAPRSLVAFGQRSFAHWVIAALISAGAGQGCSPERAQCPPASLPPAPPAMERSRAWIAVLVALACATAAAGSCEGGSCPEQAAAARAAGLLGSNGASNGCTPKQYPETGALGVVSCRRHRCRLPPAGTHLASRRLISGLAAPAPPRAGHDPIAHQ